MLRHREFDVAEMSLSSYAVSLFSADRPFIAIPVFPVALLPPRLDLRERRRPASATPKDLIGKRVGCPEYQMTAPVWMRGILSDHYGVPVDSTSPISPAARRSRTARRSSSSICRRTSWSQPIGPGQDALGDAREGEIDALLHGARALHLLRRQRAREAPLRELRRGRARLFPRHAAFFRSCTPSSSAATSTRRTAGSRSRCSRRSPRRRRLTYRDLAETAAQKAMLPWAHRAFRGGAARDGRRLLALRVRAEPRDAGDVPALFTSSRACRSASSSPRSCSRRRRSRAFKI